MRGRPGAALRVPLPRGTWVVRSDRLGVSVRVRGPSLLLGLALWALAATVAAVSLTLGDFAADPGAVLAALTGRADPLLTHVVVGMRLPRVCVALGVGAALAMSGLLLQRLAGNPLVSPDIIGVNTGAAAAAVCAIVVFGGSTPGVAGGALAGAVGTALALYLLAYRRGVSGHRLVLVGIGVTAMLGSATSYLLTRAEIGGAERAMVWLAGSLANRDHSHTLTVALGLAVLAPVVLALTRQLRLLELGADTAAALGGRVQPARAALLFTAAALAALATAVAGPVPFVALVAPQIIRRCLSAGAAPLPTAACGALLVVAADILARTVWGSGELPVGVVTGALGAPYLLYLLARSDASRPTR